MNRVQNTKTVLWALLGLAAAVGITRFIYGLGVTTNLTDASPWGVWIGFDVMAGVALAGGGKAGWNYFYKELPIGGEHWAEIADISPHKVEVQLLFALRAYG